MRQIIQLIMGVLVVLCTVNVYSQDIEQLIKAEPLTTNGGLSFSQIGTHSSDSNNVAKPYSYFVSANINSKLFGLVDLPFSFAYTNSQTNGQTPQPFNRFSLAPSYKWIKTYMGYSSMSFSPYTLSGHEFFGGGIELSPGKAFRISAMYGRLKKAVFADTLGTDPIYQRMGGGFKFDYLNKYVDVGVSLFKAKDKMNSIPLNIEDSTFVKPEDNITGSVSLNVKLLEGVSLTTDYGFSALNHDISLADSLPSIKNDKWVMHSGDLVVYHAFKGSVSQSSKIGKIGVSYEHVDPNYRTLGAYYFNNDFENITADFSTTIKKWMNFSMNIGYQKDNLENQNTNTSSRLIYSINTALKPFSKLSISSSYSNISSYVHIRNIYNEVEQTNQFQNLDTLSFTQINLTESINVSYMIESNKSRRQNINLGFAYQETSTEQNKDAPFDGTKMYNSTMSYQFSLIPQRLNVSTAINYNKNMMPDMVMNITSYNLSVQKAFENQIKTAFIATYSKSFNNEANIANILNIRITGGYTIQKRHNLNLSVAMVNNKSTKRVSTLYSANMSYNYIFNFQIKRDKKKLKFEGCF